MQSVMGSGSRRMIRGPGASSMRATRLGVLIVVLVVGLPLALFVRSFGPDPLPAPPPTTDPLPPAHPPPEMAIYALPAGSIHRTSGFAYRGGSWFERQDSCTTAALLRHPVGDLLIDTGFGRHIDEQFTWLPRLLRWTTTYERFTPAVDQLAAIGYSPKSLRAVLLTHAHWDHVSGMTDFPETLVWITPAERRYIADDGASTEIAKKAVGTKWEEYGFEDKPYLGFPKSRDVYGDGAVVIVHAPGHTPGSVIVFVALPSGKRYAFVGDIVWRLEGVTLREEKPWLMRRLLGEDEKTLRNTLLRVIGIHERYPEITIVPAHDPRGFADMPRLAALRP